MTNKPTTNPDDISSKDELKAESLLLTFLADQRAGMKPQLRPHLLSAIDGLLTEVNRLREYERAMEWLGDRYNAASIDIDNKARFECMYYTGNGDLQFKTAKGITPLEAIQSAMGGEGE